LIIMYLDFYKLLEEPFRLTPDPKFLQLAEPHRNALAVLAHGVAGRKGLMVLSGVVGTGKTTVLHGLLALLAGSFPQNTLSTALIVNPRLNPDELLETLLFEYEMPGNFTSKPARIAALQKMMFSASRSGGTCLLIIDEAHLLAADTLEEIRLLMNADSYQEKLLQVILCGQPELCELLQTPGLGALRQRIAQRAALRELSLGETRMYVSERLRIAGMQTAMPFPSAVLTKLHECSEGIPRMINILADTCLAIGAATKRNIISDDIVEEAVLQHGVMRGSYGSLAAVPPADIERIESADSPSRSVL
jgi:general secretion pathway protein A